MRVPVTGRWEEPASYPMMDKQTPEQNPVESLELPALEQSPGYRGRDLRAVVRALQNAKAYFGRPLGGQAGPGSAR